MIIPSSLSPEITPEDIADAKHIARRDIQRAEPMLEAELMPEDEWLNEPLPDSER